MATPADWVEAVARRIAEGERLAALFGTAHPPGVRLTALLADAGTLRAVQTRLAPGHLRFPSLAPRVPAAAWFERELHDLFGVTATGRARLDPLVLPQAAAHAVWPTPGDPGAPVGDVEVHTSPLSSHVRGPGTFTLPLGPVRSGVVESAEYLIEGPGEDIAHVRVRPHYKHRGLEKRFEGLDLPTGVLLAERVEGVASVAHALAYCQAVEGIAGVTPPAAARWIRTAYAELERLANHLHSLLLLAEAAGLGVGIARLGYHKERVLRLLGSLSGSRFGRGVITPGGVHQLPGVPLDDAVATLRAVERDVTRDAELLLTTPSFLDRLRGTGRLPAAIARAYATCGPVARASGVATDVRVDRPYAGYGELGPDNCALGTAGDALERTRVRWAEMRDSLVLARTALVRLADLGPNPQLRAEIPAQLSGYGVGSAEAPQGEVLYWVECADGVLHRCKPRSASFVNLAAFPQVFTGDITTDFAFIEASFAVSIAGVAL